MKMLKSRKKKLLRVQNKYYLGSFVFSDDEEQISCDKDHLHQLHMVTHSYHGSTLRLLDLQLKGRSESEVSEYCTLHICKDKQKFTKHQNQFDLPCHHVVCKKGILLRKENNYRRAKHLGSCVLCVDHQE